MWKRITTGTPPTNEIRGVQPGGDDDYDDDNVTFVCFNLRGQHFWVPKYALRAYPESLLATLTFRDPGTGMITPEVIRDDGIPEYHLDRDPALFQAILNLHYQRVSDEALRMSGGVVINRGIGMRVAQDVTSDEERWLTFKEELAFYNIVPTGHPLMRLMSEHDDEFGSLPSAASLHAECTDVETRALHHIVNDICSQLRPLLMEYAVPTQEQLLSNLATQAATHPSHNNSMVRLVERSITFVCETVAACRASSNNVRDNTIVPNRPFVVCIKSTPQNASPVGCILPNVVVHQLRAHLRTRWGYTLEENLLNTFHTPVRDFNMEHGDSFRVAWYADYVISWEGAHTITI